VTRFLTILDGFIDAGLIVLLIFTPLAFGSVEIWAQAIAQFLIVLVFAAWVLKVTWGPAPAIMHLDEAGRHDSATASTHRRRRVGFFGGRVRVSGLALPAVLFALLVGLQMVPLPAHWLQAVSPRAAGIRSDSLPVPDAGEPLTLRELESWLVQRADAPRGPSGRLPEPDPGNWTGSLLPDAEFSLTDSLRNQTISLAPGATRRQLAIYLAFLALFILGVNQWRDRRHADRIFAILGIVTGLVSILAIVQKLAASGRIHWFRDLGQAGSPFGPFGDSNHFAGYLAMLLPVTVGLMAATASRMRHERDPTVRLLEQEATLLPRLVLLAGAAAFAVVALLASGSRGGLVSILMATALYFLLSPLRQPPGWKSVVLGGLLVVLALGVAARAGGDGLWSRTSSLAEPAGEPSIALSLDTARRSLQMAADYPVTGVGLGAFDATYPMYAHAGRVSRTGAARSDCAQIAAETGLPGVTLAAVALVVLLVAYLGPALLRTGSPRRHVVRGLAVGILAMLINSILSAGLQVYSNGLLFVVLVALLVADSLARLPAPGAAPPADVAPSGS